MAKRGPNTPEGKAIVRLNAVRHGIFASDPVVPGVEDPEEWQAFREELIGALAPVGAFEGWWADRITSVAWRLRRIDRFEAEVIAVGQERVERDFSTMARVRTTPLPDGALPPGGMSMKDLYDQKPRSRAEAQLRLEVAEACLRLLTGLPGLPSGALVDDGAALEMAFNILTEDEPELLERPFDGFPLGIGASEPGWNALLLRKALEALAEAQSTTPEELLTWAIGEAEERMRAHVDELAFVIAELDRMRRERSLPDGHTMVQLTRYESGLTRKLHQALGELEALQARRKGATAPFSRLQIQHTLA